MRLFAQLFTKLDQTEEANAKVHALLDYFEQANENDKLWTIALLSHRRPKRVFKIATLQEWALQTSDIPEWLFDESHRAVGDMAETIALILPSTSSKNNQSLTDWINLLIAMQKNSDEDNKTIILKAWSDLNYTERFIINKLSTGGFRMNVSQKLMVRALSLHTKIEETVLAHKLIGDWTPLNTSFESLILSKNESDLDSKPYPNQQLSNLEHEVDNLKEIDDWLVEYKWDGIRSQIIVRNQSLYIWSGEELVTNKFPEFEHLATLLPDHTVLDGEIIPFKNNRPLPFTVLKSRIARKNITKKALEEAPLVMMAFDLLEWAGNDLRQFQLEERRAILERLINSISKDSHLTLSPIIDVKNWSDLTTIRDQSRLNNCEGIILKRKDSEYSLDKNNWLKWKADPYTINAVMLYAQSGKGRSAKLFTEFTVAVWDNDQLIPFTKADTLFSNAELKTITAYVRKNTIERFGPVRSVKGELVFEVSFEGINLSARHKSGVILRLPKIKRWRKDKQPSDANSLKELRALIAPE